MSLIRCLKTIYPATRYAQSQLAEHLVGFCRHIAPGWHAAQRIPEIFANSGIQHRAFLFDPKRIYEKHLTSTETFPEIVSEMTHLKRQAIDALVAADPLASRYEHLVSASSLSVSPSFDIRALSRQPHNPRAGRTPLSGVGCAGGAMMLARAHTFLQQHPESAVLVSSVECGSRYWLGTLPTRLRALLQQATTNGGGCTSNVTADIWKEIIPVCVFGDGASSALILGSKHPAQPPLRYPSSSFSLPNGPFIVDSCSLMVSGTLHLAHHTVEACGFRVIVEKHLKETVLPPALDIIQHLLKRNELNQSDIRHWILHPGGPYILAGVQKALHLSDADVAPCWASLQEFGNCSSVSVMNILGRIMSEKQQQHTMGSGYGIVLGIGPGITLEALLLRWE